MGSAEGRRELLLSCHGIDRAFQHPDVNIGWRPYRSKTGTNVQIRSKPSGHGELMGALTHAEGCGLQSVRNPRRSDKPASRPFIKGDEGRWYGWIYQRAGSHTGWVPADLIEPDPNFASKSYCDGPASWDFEIGRQPCPQKKPSGCGDVSTSGHVVVVTAATMYIRYSPHGTAVHFAHEGDKIKLLIVNGPEGEHFGEITEAAADGSLRAGHRGWFEAAHVKVV
jgi:hypothetical protein